MQKFVLVLEEDVTLRDTIISMLEVVGYQANGFSSARQVYDVLDAVKVDVLLISLSLFDLDGVHIAANARNHQQELKVVVADWREIPKQLSPQIDAFLRKPFWIEELHITVEAVTSLL